MFDEIMEKFEGSPSQQAVIRLLLERGFSVNEAGRVVSGGIEIPFTEIAREIDVDRDRKSTRLNSSHRSLSRMPSSA